MVGNLKKNKVGNKSHIVETKYYENGPSGSLTV
jgi:hypothetical protein